MPNFIEKAIMLQELGRPVEIHIKKTSRNRKNIILALQKFDTYKEISVELHLREFIIALRMIPKGPFHLMMDGEPKELSFTF